MPGSSPGFTLGVMPTPDQWNSYFAGKADYAAFSQLQQTVSLLSQQVATLQEQVAVLQAGSSGGETSNNGPATFDNSTFDGTQTFGQ